MHADLKEFNGEEGTEGGGTRGGNGKLKEKAKSSAFYRRNSRFESRPTPVTFHPFSLLFSPFGNIIPLTLEALPTANSPFNPLELLAPQSGLLFFFFTPEINEFFIFVISQIRIQETQR